ncbi:hypothetical protein [Bacterioplanoides sp.]|uniref:hypothetical protein n=1 Tax=Bacterioplanoides sp. TaxID=2066072 RepID=UPI003B5A5AB3
MSNFGRINAKGMVITKKIYSQIEMVELANSLGRIARHPNGEKLAILKSSNGANSRPGTFSKNYGLSAFPFHTDTSFWGEPARYIVMGMLNKSSCSTNYISIDDLFDLYKGDFVREGQKSIYLIETFEGCKYTLPIFYRNGELGLRFDPNIMTPLSKHACSFHLKLQEAINSAEPERIEWVGNKAVIIDNWKYLHSRSAVKGEDREVLRVYLES